MKIIHSPLIGTSFLAAFLLFCLIGNSAMDYPDFGFELKSLIGTLPIFLGDPRKKAGFNVEIPGLTPLYHKQRSSSA